MDNVSSLMHGPSSVPTGVSQQRAWTAALWLLLFFTYFQFTITFELDAKGTLRWVYVIYPVVAMVAIRDFRFLKLSTPLVFLASFAFFNLVAYSRFGFAFEQNRKVFYIAFSATYYFVGCAMARRLPYESLLRTYRQFLLLFLCAIAAHDFVWVAQYGTDLYGNAEAEANTYVVGGLNAESQWVAILLPLLFGTGFFWWCSIFLLYLSSLYASRAAFVFWAVLCLINGYRWVSGSVLRLTVSALVIAAMVMVFLLFFSDSQNQLVARFSNFGTSADSGTGRLIFWGAGLLLLVQNPLGYGVGNVIDRVTNMWSGIPLDKKIDNLENLYLQMPLEAGVIPLAIYLWMIFIVIRRYRKSRDCTQIFYVMVMYWITQNLGGGSGTDAGFWFVAGLFFTYTDPRREKLPGPASARPTLQ